MKTQASQWTISGSALLSAVMLAQGSTALAQQAGVVVGQPRTVNERLVEESPAPPPATSEAARKALSQSPAGVPTSQGMDAALLVEHAITMGIEGSNLLAIAGPPMEGSNDLDPVRNLRNKARKLMVDSQTLLGQAAADGRGLSATPVVGRFHSAADGYLKTLAAMNPGDPSERARMAMINQNVKDVLDADHIRQMSRRGNASPALEQMKTHAAAMKIQGSEMIRRLEAEGQSNNSIPVNVATLASRGRQLIDAAEDLNRWAETVSAQVQPGLSNPGRFPSNQPGIIGGTYGTGSPRVGTYQGLDHPTGSTSPKAESEPSSIPTYSKGTTGSTGGLRPQ